MILLINYVANTWAQNAGGEKSERNDGLTAFFLQDPNDSMCLGPHGFTACDISALWLYASRGEGEGHSLVSLLEPDPGLGCLSRLKPTAYSNSPVGVHGCGKKEAKLWILEGPNQNGYYRLSDIASASKRQQCVTRYKGGGKREILGPKGRLRNSVSLQPCEKHPLGSIAEETGYVQLDVVETAIHDAGFYIQTADGLCFDGVKFRKCEPVSDLLWGIGVHFNGKGEVERTLFKFHNRGRCLFEDSTSSSLDIRVCSEKQARRWGLKDGHLVP